MKKMSLGAMLAAAAIAPGVLAPHLVSSANAQTANAQPNAGANLGDVPAGAQRADYPDVPETSFAYEAVNRLSQIGVIEGRPGGTYNGNEPMTRYEFAVAIARLLNRLNQNPGQPIDLTAITNRLTTLEGRPVPDIFRADVVELINALRTEFRDELNRLGVRVTDVENRLTNLENRVPAPPRQSLGFGLLHRVGYTSYLASAPGRNFIAGNNGVVAGDVDLNFRGGERANAANKRFSYTELELRLSDRVTDRLSATASLRSLGSTQEDPWTGNSGGGVYVRELYAVADLSDRSFLKIRGLNAILGRQRTKIGQGLLYDNQLSPTDQVHALFRLGPLAVNAFVGANNNQVISGFGNDDSGNPYLEGGAAGNLGGAIPGVINGVKGTAFVGFPNGGQGAQFAEDNESLVHVSANLFRLGGQPVSLGATIHPDGVANQKGVGFDLTLPLFNRTVGFEYVKQLQYADGSDPNDFGDSNRNPGAYILTIPGFRSRILDIDFAYGRANNRFEYFASSAANPYARSYGEAIFDRQLFLGAPLIAGEGGDGGRPLYAAAKRGYAFNGTARLPLPLLRRIPLDFMFYRAKGTGDIDLGRVYTVGTGFNVTPGLDLELKFGRYDVPGPTASINYYRLGANLGF